MPANSESNPATAVSAARPSDDHAPLAARRSAGVFVPLSSLRSERNHGIGDTRDLYRLIDWASARGLGLIQMLPLSPVSPAAPFPYSAYSAFGIDLIYIALDDVEDVRTSSGAQELLSRLAGKGTLQAFRSAERLDYAGVYAVKRQVLLEAYQSFQSGGEAATVRRRAEFQRFRDDEREWLEDYAIFSMLKDRYGWQVGWTLWPREIREHLAPALKLLQREQSEVIGFYAYTQWIAHEQWRAARHYARAAGVALMGDLPIYVGGDSVDVWAQRGQFDLEADGGAPPDYFNWLGQNWGMPIYDWDRMRQDGYSWWRNRSQYHAGLFDALRFDHFRGLSEYWRIPKRPAILDDIEKERDKPRIQKEYEKVAWFWPIKFQFQFREKMSEAAWEQLSEADRLQVLKHINAEWKKGPADEAMKAILEASAGSWWVVEDLGAHMDAVFELRDRLGLAGMRVVQFFGYDEKGRANPHVDPRQYPENSFAMTDSHDLPPLREWVASLSIEERERIAKAYGLPLSGQDLTPEAFECGVIKTLFECPSRWVILSLQTLTGLGRGHRINTPGTVGDHNWTWRMPMTLESLGPLPFIEDLTRKTRRLSAR